MRSLWLVAGLCFPALGCLSETTHQSVERALTESSARLREAPVAPELLSELSGPIRRQAVVELAVSQSPGLAAMARRARAMVYGARAEAALPAPELGLEAWNLPLARPYAFGEADMYMVELRQRLPAAGSLDARARATAEEAHALVAELATEERQIAQRAADAYADYVHGTRDHAIHQQHLALLEQMQAAVRARYTTGGAGLADAARAELEIAKTRRAIARVDGDIARACAMINALLRRPSDAPLGRPLDTEPQTIHLSLDELATRAARNRGAFGAARDRIQAARARREAAEAEATWPEFMLGLGYWQDPGTRPGVGAKVSLSLPWLWGGQGHRVEEAREREAAEASALGNASLEAESEISEAHARVAAAERELRVLRERVLPAARRSIEAVRAVYLTGNASLLEWVDAARSTLDLQMEETDVSAELARAVASLERSVGAALPLTAIVTEDVR